MATPSACASRPVDDVSTVPRQHAGTGVDAAQAGFRLPVRDDLVQESPYGAPQLDVPVRLNVNENPYPVPPAVVTAMADAVRAVGGTLNRYPDREAWGLRSRLAAYLKTESNVAVDVPQIWAANGSNEVMQQIHLAFGGPGRTSLAFVPTYSMYAQYCRDTFTRYATAPRQHDFTIDPGIAAQALREWQPSLVLIASPNNPTGTAMDLGVLEEILAAAHHAGALVVVDEAYAEFRRPQTPSALELLGAWPNLIVSRTMSKAFGLAGARVGYAVAAQPAAIEALRIVRLPYHLSEVTQAIASVALDHASVMQEQVATIRAQRDELVDWLAAVSLGPLPSDANFVCFGPLADADSTWQGLLDRGVLIRASGPPGYLRVSVGTPEENGRFRDALAAVLSLGTSVGLGSGVGLGRGV